MQYCISGGLTPIPPNHATGLIDVVSLPCNVSVTPEKHSQMCPSSPLAPQIGFKSDRLSVFPLLSWHGWN